jgi:hypothetical protein
VVEKFGLICSFVVSDSQSVLGGSSGSISLSDDGKQVLISVALDVGVAGRDGTIQSRC